MLVTTTGLLLNLLWEIFDRKFELTFYVQRYCCLGVLFAHALLPSNSSSYHIRGNEMNCVGSSEYMAVFTSFTRASFVNMQADQSSSWLIRPSFPKSTILQRFCPTKAFAKCPNTATLSHFVKFSFLKIFGFI